MRHLLFTECISNIENDLQVKVRSIDVQIALKMCMHHFLRKNVQESSVPKSTKYIRNHAFKLLENTPLV